MGWVIIPAPRSSSPWGSPGGDDQTAIAWSERWRFLSLSAHSVALSALWIVLGESHLFQSTVFFAEPCQRHSDGSAFWFASLCVEAFSFEGLHRAGPVDVEQRVAELSWMVSFPS